MHLINTKRVAWHMGMPSGPDFKPISAAACVEPVQPGVDPQLVQQVVEQVLKAIQAGQGR
jgi:acetaldehyde dehydrogenase (acetylating)